MLYNREPKTRKMKVETLKTYCAILVLYKATIILMVRQSFLRAGFSRNPRDLSSGLIVTPAEVLDQIVPANCSWKNLSSLELMKSPGQKECQDSDKPQSQDRENLRSV
jgi:hypothetical protein